MNKRLLLSIIFVCSFVLGGCGAHQMIIIDGKEISRKITSDKLPYSLSVDIKYNIAGELLLSIDGSTIEKELIKNKGRIKRQFDFYQSESEIIVFPLSSNCKGIIEYNVNFLSLE